VAIYFKRNEFFSQEKRVVSNESEEYRLRAFVHLVFFPVFMSSIREHNLHLEHGKKHPQVRHIWCVPVTIAVKGHGKRSNKCNRSGQKKTGSFGAKKISGKHSNHRSNADLLTRVTVVTLVTKVVVIARRTKYSAFIFFS